jgi:mycothiol synthase
VLPAEVVTEPDGKGGRRWTIRVDGPDLDEAGPALLRDAVEQVREGGGGEVVAWVYHAGPRHDSAAAAAGLAPDRELYQMRVSLPVEEAWRLDVRGFAPGRDERAWLEANNRAFADHPEQGEWDLGTLRERMAEPWFDPEGFLLHERDGRLAGFCWTKVHAGHEPPLGEIYVIGVDPDFHGRGLGRALTLAGLDRLWRQGLNVGMLYVDAANRPALSLYRSLGFTVDHQDRSYTGTV